MYVLHLCGRNSSSSKRLQLLFLLSCTDINSTCWMSIGANGAGHTVTTRATGAQWRPNIDQRLTVGSLCQGPKTVTRLTVYWPVCLQLRGSVGIQWISTNKNRFRLESYIPAKPLLKTHIETGVPASGASHFKTMASSLCQLINSPFKPLLKWK